LPLGVGDDRVMIVRLAIIGVLLTPATAAAAPAVSVRSGLATRITMCGAARSAKAVAAGTTLWLAVPGSAHTRRGAIVIDACESGRWVRNARVALRTRELAAGASADLRLRARVRGARHGRAAYVRVGQGEIVDAPVSFEVTNQNRTVVPCLGAPDGKRYTVGGTLVAPRAVLQAAKPGVTLYLHGLGYGGFFFRFQAVPGYDYALEQARAGHASIVVDRLGNPANGRLRDGLDTCLSSQADIAAQMLGDLRSGRYTLGRSAGTGFDTVVLAGHSAGGFITEVEQYSFRAADAIAVISFNDTPGPLTLGQFFAAGNDCLTAPQHADGATGAPNYASFGKTAADFKAAHLHDVEPAVETAVLAMRSRDPCGELLNALNQLVADEVLVRTITSPVLVIAGANDALFPPPSDRLAAGIAFPRSADRSFVELPDTGHAVTLGRSHEAFRKAMDAWLTKHGA
jgi:pimeloyl-ACP methyl ester carboxylesterase